MMAKQEHFSRFAAGVWQQFVLTNVHDVYTHDVEGMLGSRMTLQGLRKCSHWSKGDSEELLRTKLDDGFHIEFVICFDGRPYFQQSVAIIWQAAQEAVSRWMLVMILQAVVSIYFCCCERVWIQPESGADLDGHSRPQGQSKRAPALWQQDPGGRSAGRVERCGSAPQTLAGSAGPFPRPPPTTLPAPWRQNPLQPLL